jgi:hypothetical protein
MGSISAAFSFVSFVAGLFCVRLKTALIAGAIPALLYAALVVVGLWDILDGVDVPYFLGILTASMLAILLPAVIASYLRRGTAALIRRLRGSQAD